MRNADRTRADRDHEAQQVEEVLEAADDSGNCGAGDDDALAPVDGRVDAGERGEDERHGEGQQREDLAAQRAQAEGEAADRERQQGAQPGRDRDRQEKLEAVPSHRTAVV